ncbi:agmatinase [Actibacterium sp. 188UL27-1]|uniref:agmatinase n=1 Tax=Actibacterium sp. 188UL27-1 TaxID=2786961 RepID=UPI00195782CE|nr:agmatinase [Actibacterium sp. 188UL27-1]MBM7067204.1 agmatinase [Actibacterium sp. 188UL27-1]
MTTFRPPATPDRWAPRFAEVATLLRAPLADRLDGVDIGLFGIPYDGALTNRPGARHGPREIRNQSSLIRSINHATRIDPFARCQVRDMGDVAFTSMFDIEASHGEIATFATKLVHAGILPLGFGGDHSVSLPLLRAVAADGPVALIHVDAHTDTWDSFQGSKFNHGAPFRRAVEEGLIDPKATIQIGIRGTQNSAEGWDYSQAHGMRVVFCEELHATGPAAIADEARALVGDRPVYLSFDIDSLDPVYAPGTGTPEIGGMTTHQAQVLLRGLRNLSYVGADLVEVSPPFDTGYVTSLAGAALGYEILCLLAESWSKT